MASFEIEIALHHVGADYQVDVRFDRSDSEADVAPVRGEAKFDLEALRARSNERAEYGKLLYQSLFYDPKVHARFERVCSFADQANMPVRLRLFIATDAAELHPLIWEALRDPASGELLVTRERFLFSRFISNED